MNKCFICNNNIEEEDKLFFVKCKCSSCGSFAYEKNFVTSYNYYKSSFKKENMDKVEEVMKKIINNQNVCFVDDFETSIVEGYDLIEFRDVLNMAGIDMAHNNTIDSNWKD